MPEPRESTTRSFPSVVTSSTFDALRDGAVHAACQCWPLPLHCHPHPCRLRRSCGRSVTAAAASTTTSPLPAWCDHANCRWPRLSRVDSMDYFRHGGRLWTESMMSVAFGGLPLSLRTSSYCEPLHMLWCAFARRADTSPRVPACSTHD